MPILSMWTFTSLILILAHLQYLYQDQSTQCLSYETVTILNSCLTWPRDMSNSMLNSCQWKVEVFVDDSPLETASKLPLDGVRRHCIQTRAYLTQERHQPHHPNYHGGRGRRCQIGQNSYIMAL